VWPRRARNELRARRRGMGAVSGRSTQSLGVTTQMESLGWFLILAWMTSLPTLGLWLYVRTIDRVGEIHTVFAVAAIFCGITLVSSWILFDAGSATLESMVLLGVPVVASLVGALGVAIKSFQADSQRSRDA
jgi:hypothetical protein